MILITLTFKRESFFTKNYFANNSIDNNISYNKYIMGT